MRSRAVLWSGWLLACAPLQAESIFRSGFEAGEQAPGRAKTIGIGSNLESVIDFAAAYPFADFFKQSRPWITSAPAGCTPPDIEGASCFDTLEADRLDLDADGWVRSLPACDDPDQTFCIARTVLFSNPSTVYPSGAYTIRYDGVGTLAYFQNSTPLTPVSSPGQDVLTLNGNQIFQLDILATAPPPNHLRNIRIYPPGIDPDDPPLFHPDFLARLAPYRTLRFMDWMEANGDGFDFPFEPNTQQRFTERPLPSHAHFSRDAGVPVEVMVELANASGSEPWFTLPQRVDDDYVAGFARIVRDQLRPGLDIYVEHSNEVWNNFPQRFDIEARALETMLPEGCPLDQEQRRSQPECPSNFDLRLNQHGLRTRQICDLFRSEFGPQANRIICTLGAQAANPFTAAEAADCPRARAAGLIDSTCLGAGDALAIAPYFANYTNREDNEDEISGWTLDQLFAEISQGGQLEQNQATPCTDNGNTFANRVVDGRCTVSALEEIEFFISASKQAADDRDMRLVAYEGGQHLALVSAFSGDAQAQARKDAVTALFVAANRDPRMEQLYVDYFGRWKQLGGELFAHFALTFPYGPSGSWGVLESLTQNPDPPKVRGIDAFNGANPCWWQGCGIEQPDPDPPSCPQPVVDGGFEATASDNSNPNWNSTSTQFGSALCDTGISLCADDPNATGSVGPRSGTAWTWFGVDAGNEEASVSQTVTLPDDGPRHLNFHLRRGFVSTPFDATLEVRLGATLLQTLSEPGSADAGYGPISIDLASQPRSQPLLLEFRYRNGGDGKSNFNLDDISIDCAPATP